MLLTEAAEWAAVDVAHGAELLLADSATRSRLTGAIAAAFWTYVWPEIRDDRLKVSIWFLRPSVRIAALQPWFEMVFGPAPREVAP